MLDQEIDAIKQQIKVDARLRRWYDRSQKDAEKMIKELLVVHRLIGPRLLDQIRHRNSDFTSMFESQVPASWAGLMRTPSMRIAPFSLTITAKTNGLSA